MYALVVGAVGAVFFGIVLAQVNSFINRTNARAIAKDQKMSGFLAYLSTCKRMNRDLRSKAIDAYAYFLDQRADVELADSLRGLPDVLQSNLITTLYGSTINRLRFFDGIQSDHDFITSFIFHCKPFMASNHDLIFGSGDIATELVFLLHGSVQLWTTAIGIEGGRIIEGYSTQGEYFGDFEYCETTTRIVNYSAFMSSELLGISYNSLRQLLAEHPEVAVSFKREMRSRYSTFLLAVGSSSIQTLRRDVLSRDRLWFNGELRSSTYVDYKDYYQTSREHFSVIVSIEKDDDGVELLTTVLETSMQLLNRFVVFPSSSEKLAWDFLVSLLIFYVAFCETVIIAFGRRTEGPWEAMSIFVFVVFTIDIGINFMTAFKHESYSTYVAVHSYIAKNYLQTWFLVDFMSAIPFNFMFSKVHTSASLIQICSCHEAPRFASHV